MKLNILIVHGFSSYPIRATARDLLFCYEKYLPEANCFYLNLNDRLMESEPYPIPEYIYRIKFDVILFHTLFLSGRWAGEDFFQNKILNRVLSLKNFSAVKAILPQDEWIHCNSLVKFIKEMNINYVFSVTPPSEWEIVYKGVDFTKVKFYEVLTGYIDDKLAKKIDKSKAGGISRDIDIGYRAFKSPPWLGRHGFLKTHIAEVFKKFNSSFNYKIDISTEIKDTIYGDKWYEFMLRCRYFAGVEGGSTVLDPSGEIWRKGEEYMKMHPDASLEEVEKNVFSGLEGTVHFVMMSPRHLEACMTETCQVLIEGRYNEVLKPDIHYLEIKKDFSNLTELFQRFTNEEERVKMTSRAYRDIVLSGAYKYSTFVRRVLKISLQYEKPVKRNTIIRDAFLLYKNKQREKVLWKKFKELYVPKKESRMRVALKKYEHAFKYKIKPRVTGRIKKIMAWKRKSI